NVEGLRLSLYLNRDPLLLRERREKIAGSRYNTGEVDHRLRLHVKAELDPRKRHQVVDQPRHAPSLLGHDTEEFLAGSGIVLRRTLQRFDKARKRSQGRAQFMARIRDKIDAHLLDAALLRQIAEIEQKQVWALMRDHNRRHMHIERALDRHALFDFK